MYNEQNKRNGSVPNIIPTLNPRIENYAGNVLEENIYKKAEKLKEMLMSQDSSPCRCGYNYTLECIYA